MSCKALNSIHPYNWLEILNCAVHMPILKDFRFSIVFLYFVYGFERLVSLALYLDSIFALM